MSFISIDNFVNVSVSSPPAGLASYAVNNLAIFTKETPVNGAITASAPGVYKSPSDVLTDWGASSEVYAMANLIFGQSPNILDGDGQLVIFPMQSGDTLAVNIPLAVTHVFFGGALYAGYAPTDDELLAAATACETLRVKLFVSSYLAASATPTTGLFWKIKQATQRHARCLPYLLGGDAVHARAMAAAYAGGGLSVDFTGVNTTSTRHGKSLVGILPDTGISQTILDSFNAVGADCYISVGGGAQYVGKIFSSGANDFFDNVYNLDWLVFALQVAGFNAITTIGTKIPQTEPGMAVLKGAYISVLQQAVANLFVAPGVWNSSELFGNPADLRRNILNVGYYIYSQPINLQTQADRVARKAPLVQICVKYAGAVHSSNVIVAVNP